MIINFIVGSVTLLMLLFVLVWVFSPAARDWFERPKHRFAESERWMNAEP